MCTQNKMAINDWITIQTLFDKLNKQLEKAQKVSEPSVLPRAYIKLLAELEVGQVLLVIVSAARPQS